MFFHIILFNQTENMRIKETKLEIFEIGEDIIKEISENANNKCKLHYIINSHLNSGFNPLIIVNKNI